MPDPRPEVSKEALGAVTDAVVKIWAASHGHGPDSGKSYYEDGLLFTVLRGGMTPQERTLVERGRGDMVREIRMVYESLMFEDYKRAIEAIVAREVVDYHSQVLLRADLTVEIFVLGDGPPV